MYQSSKPPRTSLVNSTLGERLDALQVLGILLEQGLSEKQALKNIAGERTFWRGL